MLRNETIDALVSQIRAGWDPDEKLGDIVSEIHDRIPESLNAWRTQVSFQPHIEILERAVERFQAGDYVSCTGLLFPRIEGILRTHHTTHGAATSPSPANLTDFAVAAKIHNESCLLLPHRFASYLRDVYFADFNPVAQNIDVSRHSIAHGVAAPASFNQKSALIGILVVHQLFHFLNRPSTGAHVAAVVGAGR
jgi:hypothetical protein